MKFIFFGGQFWEGKSHILKDGVHLRGVHKQKGIYSHTGKRNKFESIILSFKTFFFLFKEDFDIVDSVAFIYVNCYLLWFLSKIKKFKLIFTWHQYFGDYLQGYFGSIVGTFAMFLERCSIKLANHNVTVSDFIEQELIRRGLSQSKISVVPNGVSLDLVKSVRSSNKKYDLIFVGRLNYQKNLFFLIKMVKSLSKAKPNIRVCILGGGEQEDDLKRKVNSLNLDNQIDFLGEITDPKQIYLHLKESRIFILTSFLEGFPLTIVEANACGLPVICSTTTHSDISKYILKHNVGICCKLKLIEFKHAVLSLLDDSVLYEKLSNNSVSAVKSLDWDILTEKLNSVYQKHI